LATNLRTLEFNLVYKYDHVPGLRRTVKGCVQRFRMLERINIRIKFRRKRDIQHGRWIQDRNSFLGTKGTCLNVENAYRSKVLIALWSWNMKGRAIKGYAEEGTERP
jgi:hypothetical protein